MGDRNRLCLSDSKTPPEGGVCVSEEITKENGACPGLLVLISPNNKLIAAALQVSLVGNGTSFWLASSCPAVCL